MIILILNSNALVAHRIIFPADIKSTLTIKKTNPYTPVIVVITNNSSIFFYVDGTFKGEKIIDNSLCTVERVDNSNFKITNEGYGNAMMFSDESFTCMLT